MKKNNKNWEVCVELLNEITTNAQWDKNKFTCEDYDSFRNIVETKVLETMEAKGWNTPEKCKTFLDFYYTLYHRLYSKLEKHWLNGTLTDGDWMGDDSFMDFRHDILAHGYNAYCEVMEDWTAAKKYVKNYVECFGYCLPEPEDFRNIENDIYDAIDRVLARGGVCEVEIPNDEIEDIDEYLSKIDRVGWMWNPTSNGIEVYRASQAKKYAA